MGASGKNKRGTRRPCTSNGGSGEILNELRHSVKDFLRNRSLPLPAHEMPIICHLLSGDKRWRQKRRRANSPPPGPVSPACRQVGESPLPRLQRRLVDQHTNGAFPRTPPWRARPPRSPSCRGSECLPAPRRERQGRRERRKRTAVLCVFCILLVFLVLIKRSDPAGARDRRRGASVPRSCGGYRSGNTMRSVRGLSVCGWRDPGFPDPSARGSPVP